MNKIKDLKPKQNNQYTYGAYIIPNKLTLICRECGNKQTYSNKYSYRRAMGIAGLGKSDKKENGGLCSKCRRSAKRKPHPPRSKECRLENRMNKIRRLGYNTIEEYEENIFVMGRKDTYYAKVDAMSRTNLKNYKPELYKLWRENTWDGTNYETGMTIEHKTPKSVCWKRRWSIEKAGHISNLDVMSQKDNNESWKEYSTKKILIKENKFW